MKNKTKLIDVMVHLPFEGNPRKVGCLEADFEYSEVFKDYVLSEESSLKLDSMRASYLGRFDGLAVKKLRKRLGLTQQQMSSLLGLGAKTITRWESNKSMPSLSMSENLKRIELIKNLQDDGIINEDLSYELPSVTIKNKSYSNQLDRGSESLQIMKSVDCDYTSANIVIPFEEDFSDKDLLNGFG